ncbi:MAG: class A beta-lactamase [Nevskiales bacterium]
MQQSHLSRRTFLVGAVSLIPAFRAAAAQTAAVPVFGEDARFAAIEKQVTGRLGVAALDTASGRHIGHRVTERFPLCSTFKFLAVAAVLKRVDSGQETLDRRVVYSHADLLEYAPITRQHVQEGGMTVSALCAAAIEYSDNTAANLLLQSIGGPGAIGRYAATLGDGVTRLDRTEPTLNEAAPGDPRDTSSPAAMLGNLQAILLGKALSPASLQNIQAWLIANTTGGSRLRAGLPADWRVGDKTGTGEHGATNDIAILWPPGRPPILVAAYLTDSAAPAAERGEALAEVGRVIARLFPGSGQHG